MRPSDRSDQALVGLPTAGAPDPVLDAYKKDVDRTLLRENLKLTPQERLEALMNFLRGIDELRRAEERRLSKKP